MASLAVVEGVRVFRQSKAELPTIVGLPGSANACINALLERV
jgi:hypothetical protein